MKMVPFTDFRKNASVLINEVEHGETIVLVRRGKPVAEIVPFTGRLEKLPAWKKTGTRLQFRGTDLSSAILEDREASG